MNPARKYYSIDGQLMEMDKFDHGWLKGRHMVYEVLRSCNGKAVFLDDHIARMQKTVEQSGRGHLPEANEIRRISQELISANGHEEGNILFCLARTGKKHHFLACFIKHRYPGPDDYAEGVYISSLKAMRNNPNAKIFNPVLRKKTEYLKESKEATEILLVDNDGYITEGSRSNIFFIRGDALFTPPGGKVLLGITRRKVIDICSSIRVPVMEEDILLRDIVFYESAFITGTSPKVLPIKYIDQHRFNVGNPLMRKIMEEFDRLMY